MMNEQNQDEEYSSNSYENEYGMDSHASEDKIAEEIQEIKNVDLDELMISQFKGRVVRKDLTKQ
ncbi:MAG: hypothetical protein KAH18_12835, partial [Psychromonas sp.]|nr:hypothetical protein [Psychromonas sp.]